MATQGAGGCSKSVPLLSNILKTNGLPDGEGSPSILVLYHFLPPDDVVSARIVGELCEGLAARGWRVEARPSNRSCFDPRARHPRRETRNGVEYRRVGRPAFAQGSAAGRVLNALFMTAAWSARALRPGRGPDVVLVGTDPILSVATLAAFRACGRRTRRAHWAFDVYPDAAVADGALREGSVAARLLSRAAAAGTRSAHLLADIGPCMRERLAAGPGAVRATLPPWALVEPKAPLPVDAEERRRLFGEARLAVLYSGTIGRAHSFEELLALARRLRGTGVRFVFSGRGNREAELRAAVGPDDENVGFAPFVGEEALARRLGAADVHAVTLKPAWTGTVVPSKLQAALAAGRPVLFAGSPEASPARWIAELGLGLVVTPEPPSIEAAAGELLRLADDPSAREALNLRCHAAYAERFARERTIDAWDTALRALVARGAGR